MMLTVKKTALTEPDFSVTTVSDYQQTARRIGLIAGDGLLPVHVVKTALAQGRGVSVFSIGSDNRRELSRLCKGQVHSITPGLLAKNLELLRREQVQDIVFAGKVNKWLLLRDPRLDVRALGLIRAATRMNDDKVMQVIIDELEGEGFHILPQTAFMQDLFVSEGVLSNHHPDGRQWEDISYGYQLAREMGRLDVGQTVVVTQGMILAVEAIEGTDECLKRAGKWARKKGGVVIKVAKPDQDQRFDVPTVGLKTLKTMHSMGLKVLATEANQTLFLDLPAMIEYANKHQLVIVSVDGETLLKSGMSQP